MERDLHRRACRACGEELSRTKKGQVDAGDGIVTAPPDRYNALMGG